MSRRRFSARGAEDPPERVGVPAPAPRRVSLGGEDRGDLSETPVRVGELDDSHDRSLLAWLDLKAVASDAPAIRCGRSEFQSLRPLGRKCGPGATADEVPLKLAVMRSFA